MVTRAYWKGYLKLSLVTIGVELYPAVAGTRQLTLHQIHEPSRKRIRYEKVAPGVGPVDSSEIVKGYEVGKDEYVLLRPEELDEIRLEGKHSIELVQFVDSNEIDPRYFDKPYYVVPAEDEVATEGFAVIREALRDSGKTALGQMAVRGRDYVVAISPWANGLLLETLRYADEIRESDKIFDDIPEVKVDREMLELAEQLIEKKAAPFQAGKFYSRYTKALKELIDEKRKTGKVTSAAAEELPPEGKIVDLMEALKKSVGKGAKTGGKPAGRKKSAPRKSARRAG